MLGPKPFFKKYFISRSLEQKYIKHGHTYIQSVNNGNQNWPGGPKDIYICKIYKIVSNK